MMTAHDLSQLGKPFGLGSEVLRWIRSSQNHVYECNLAGSLSILRVSSGRSRTIDEIETELDWIEDLASRGVPVCRAMSSRNNYRCEVVELDGTTHLVVQFERAPGRAVEQADISPELDAGLGELTARLHAASFDQPGRETTRPVARLPWHQSRLLNEDLERFAPPAAESFRNAVRSQVAGLIPRVADRLGLLHADLSFSNVFLDGRRLVLFDFDNCEYGPIEQDFATVLFDSVYCRLLHRVPTDELPQRISERWRAYLAGYRSVRPEVEIDSDLLRRFLILREAIIYIHYCRTVDLSTARAGFREGMEEMRENVEREVTPVSGVF